MIFVLSKNCCCRNVNTLCFSIVSTYRILSEFFCKILVEFTVSFCFVFSFYFLHLFGNKYRLALDKLGLNALYTLIMAKSKCYKQIKFTLKLLVITDVSAIFPGNKFESIKVNAFNTSTKESCVSAFCQQKSLAGKAIDGTRLQGLLR